MPPPLPTPAPPGGDCTCPPVCLRGGKDTSLYSGTGKGTGIDAMEAARHPGSSYSNEYTISVSLPLVLFFHSLASFYDTICALLELPKLGYQYYCFFGFYQCDVLPFGRRALARTPRPQLDVIQQS